MLAKLLLMTVMVIIFYIAVPLLRGYLRKQGNHHSAKKDKATDKLVCCEYCGVFYEAGKVCSCRDKSS